MGLIEAQLHPKLKNTHYNSRDTYFSKDEKNLVLMQFTGCNACFEHKLPFKVGRAISIYDGPEDQLYVKIYVDENTPVGAWIFNGIHRGEFTGVSVKYASPCDNRTGLRIGPFLKDEISIVRVPGMEDSLILSYSHKASQYITASGQLKPNFPKKKMDEIKSMSQTSGGANSGIPPGFSSTEYEDYQQMKKDSIAKRAKFVSDTIGEMHEYASRDRQLANSLPADTAMRDMIANGTTTFGIYEIAYSAIDSGKKLQSRIERLEQERANLVKTNDAAAPPATTSTAAGRRTPLDEAQAAMEKGYEAIARAYKKDGAKYNGLVDTPAASKSFQDTVNQISQTLAKKGNIDEKGNFAPEPTQTQ
jgi:hypothetical protein